jgi:dolichol-phosphate mannosyltransferase
MDTASLAKVSKESRLAPELSLVIPTRNEAGNIPTLLARIQRALDGFKIEIIFVDDSDDRTPAVIQECSQLSNTPITLLHRPPDRRGTGLGGAVVEGLRAATGQWVVVMDGDLQHPPETIVDLVLCAYAQKADLVLASRFASPKDIEGLGPVRLAISKLTGFAARTLFPGRLGHVSDPLTGFFLVRRDAVDPDRLRPRGFKILLEILVRFPELRVTEIPFVFGERGAGESKAGAREALRYFTLLCELRFGQSTAQLFRFLVVGLTGLVVNQLLLAAFTEVGGLYYVISAALATQGSTTWNFALTEKWVFNGREEKAGWMSRLVKFFVMNNVLLLLRGPFLVLLTSGLGVHYLVSNVVTLAGLMLLRFLVADRLIWREKQPLHFAAQYNYDVHGIVRIVSKSPLPELAFFRVDRTIEDPDIRVRVARMWQRGTQAIPGEHFHYHEWLGPLGFWCDITRGAYTDVVVGPVVSSSPHVLYTNVVEPILRWLFVQKGYALVHGACLALDGRALMVTAQTDTGKTTSILRMLARYPIPFLSDDMSILSPDHRILSYPKPLTISFHTLKAVGRAAALSRWERLLLHIQSRVHSKSGRLMAILLARLPLPAATINAVVQIIVPPPKFHITRLVPEATIAHSAVPTHRVEIQRGPDLRMVLEPLVAEELLLANCADAYGFPPYGALEPFLVNYQGRDLSIEERETMRSVLGSSVTTLISSESRDWWPHIIDIMFSVPHNGLEGQKTVAHSNGHDARVHTPANGNGKVNGSIPLGLSHEPVWLAGASPVDGT